MIHRNMTKMIILFVLFAVFLIGALGAVWVRDRYVIRETRLIGKSHLHLIVDYSSASRMLKIQGLTNKPEFTHNIRIIHNKKDKKVYLYMNEVGYVFETERRKHGK